MGNQSGKEGGANDAKTAAGAAPAPVKKKPSMGDLIRQGSMPGDGGKRCSNTMDVRSSANKARPLVIPKVVEILEAVEQGVWPPYAVSSVQGLRKGMEDEFFASSRVRKLFVALPSSLSNHPVVCVGAL